MVDKLLQLLRFGCSYQAIADTSCSATTIRGRCDEWIRLGFFVKPKQIVLESCARIVALVLDQIAIDDSITKAPGGGEVAGRSPVDRGKQGLKQSGMADGYGIPLGRVPAGLTATTPRCSRRPPCGENGLGRTHGSGALEVTSMTSAPGNAAVSDAIARRRLATRIDI